MGFVSEDTVHHGAEGVAVGPAPVSGNMRLFVHISVNQEEKGILVLN